MKKIGRKILWLAIALVGTTLLIPLGYYALRGLDKIEAETLEHKMVRETTATVRAKERVSFDETNHSYMHEDGYRVERQPADQEWRVYYQIDRFDQIAEPIGKHLFEAEKERAAHGRTRFAIVNKDQYDRSEVGDKLNVGWRWRGNDKIEVVSVGKPHP